MVIWNMKPHCPRRGRHGICPYRGSPFHGGENLTGDRPVASTYYYNGVTTMLGDLAKIL
jgi:hypothetical protein